MKHRSVLLAGTVLVPLIAACGANQQARVEATTPAPVESETEVARLVAGARGALDRGDVGTARSLSAMAMRSADADRETRALAAHVLLAAGDYQEAATAFSRLRSEDQNDSRFLVGEAIALIGLGRGVEARGLLLPLDPGAPETARVAANLGYAWLALGDGARARQVLEPLVAQGESTAQARQSLAAAYALQGSWIQARAMAEIDVDSAEAQHRLESWATFGALSPLDRLAALNNTPRATPTAFADAQTAVPEQAGSRLASLSTSPTLAATESPAAIDVAAGTQVAQATTVEPAVPAQAEPAMAVAVAAASDAAKPAAETTAATTVKVEKPVALAEASAPVKAESPAIVPVVKPARDYGPKRIGDAPHVVERASLVEPVAVPAAPTKEPATAAAATAQARQWFAQVGSFRTDIGLKAHRDRLEKRFPKLFESQTVRVEDAAVKGATYHRLLLDAASKQDVLSICRELKAKRAPCLARVSAAKPAEPELSI